MRIIFTGGHHNSALEVARRLRTEHKADILWLGHKHTMLHDTSLSAEYKEVTGCGIPFKELKAGKLYKTFNLRHWLRIPWSILQSFYYLARFRPQLIVSFGGYLAAPVVFAAWVLRIPSVTHEQTAVVGLANRFIARFADKVFITWEASRRYFDPQRTVLTGLPLRASIFNAESTASFSFPNELPTIYITGGKQGCHIVNMAVKEKLPELLGIANVVHQIGSTTVTNDFSALTETAERLPQELKARYVPREYVFENEIGAVFQKTDIVISRAGAHTVYEIAALGTPAIFVPISWASHGEQYANAKALADKGLAQVLDERELTGEKLLREIQEMLAQLPAYKKAGEAVKKDMPLDAADRVIGEILRYERTK